MEIIIHQPDGNRSADPAHVIVEVNADEVILSDVQDALDLMADAVFRGANSVVIHERNITPDFFDLRTGLAGEILQKFVNYNVRLAIIGDFSKYPSKSLQAFIIECNRGNHFLFANDVTMVKQKMGSFAGDDSTV